MVLLTYMLIVCVHFYHRIQKKMNCNRDSKSIIVKNIPKSLTDFNTSTKKKDEYLQYHLDLNHMVKKIISRVRQSIKHDEMIQNSVNKTDCGYGNKKINQLSENLSVVQVV